MSWAMKVLWVCAYSYLSRFKLGNYATDWCCYFVNLVIISLPSTSCIVFVLFKLYGTLTLIVGWRHFWINVYVATLQASILGLQTYYVLYSCLCMSAFPLLPGIVTRRTSLIAIMPSLLLAFPDDSGFCEPVLTLKFNWCCTPFNCNKM